MIAGIVFSVLSSVCINWGNVVEKQAVDRLPPISARRSPHLIRTLLSSRHWMSGFVLTLVGLGLQVLALSRAPIPVVQSIFNAGIVILLIGSRVRLGERLRRTEIAGLAIVVAAVTSVTASLRGSDVVGNAGSLASIAIAAGPTLLVAFVVLRMRPHGRHSHPHSGIAYGVSSGLLYGLAALGTKGASTLIGRFGVVHGVPLIFSSIYPYLFAVFSVAGLVVYQTGLQRSRISVVGSMSDVIAGTYMVAVGTVVFGEPLPTDPVTLTLRLAGFAGVLVGSLVVAGGHLLPAGVGSASSWNEDFDLGENGVLVLPSEELDA
ncbi:MAG TPA: DMT family transporter [Acidimicrobiales bacterium]|nr:DMT family transporter [Acidimicrobiales bacterium]